ncbi:hypothetical protein ACTFIW_008557 [Dictyostelium discoideum]
MIFPFEVKIDTINNTLVVSLNSKIDEVSHFTTSHRNKRDEAKNYNHSIDIECDQCLARGKLLNGLSMLKDFNYISLNNYLIATQQIKIFNHDQVFQFKIDFYNPHLSSTIIDSIHYHLDHKSFTINNNQQIINEIQSLDSYGIQY